MSVRIAAIDLNGQFRGKRLAAGMEDKSVRMPLSVQNVDIFGADIEGSPLVFDTGDADGVLQPTGRGPVPLPWLGQGAVLQPAWMFDDDGVPFAGDPRHALDAVLTRYAARSWHVIAACELEFYLVEADGNLAAPINPRTGKRVAQTEILSLRELDGFDGFFSDVERGAAAMDIDPLVITSEAGVGQFEITMTHGPALKIADDVVLLKELIKGTARQHGMAATFLAKPFPAESGSGLHTHFSILDKDGENVFTDDGTLRHAVSGCLDALAPSTLIFAPHASSFARFQASAHAPVNATWGYENRTVALRVPGGPLAARRIEHRVAGGDINPYLLFAAVFGAAMSGIDAGHDPPAPTTGNAYTQTPSLPGLHRTWDQAIEGLDHPALHDILPPLLIDNLQRTKRQEAALMAQMSDHDILTATLEAV